MQLRLLGQRFSLLASLFHYFLFKQATNNEERKKNEEKSKEGIKRKENESESEKRERSKKDAVHQKLARKQRQNSTLPSSSSH